MSEQREAFTVAEMVAFLDGSAPLDGVWFGEPHPAERGNFWWRKHLKAALSSAPSAEPVLYIARNKSYKKFYATSFSKAEAELFLARSGLKNDGVEAEVLGLYAAPPNLSVAVAAAIEQAAQKVDFILREGGGTYGNVIRALQSPDGLVALWEFGMKIATECFDHESWVLGLEEEIVDRVLKGE